MKVNWIVEDIGEDLSPLINEIKKQGHVVRMIDHLNGPYSSKDLFPSDEPCIFYGSLQEAQSILRDGTSSYMPGPLLNSWRAFECTSYYNYFDEFLFNSRYRFSSLYEAFRMLKGERFFIRPNSGLKTFTGQVVDLTGHMLTGLHLPTFMRKEHLDDAYMMVVTAPVKRVVEEYRFIIWEGHPISWSSYPDKRDVPDSVIVYAASVALNVYTVKGCPHTMYTLDIGVGEDGGMGVLEIGCASTSSFYHCKLGPIVSAMSRTAREEWLEFQPN